LVNLTKPVGRILTERFSFERMQISAVDGNSCDRPVSVLSPMTYQQYKDAVQRYAPERLYYRF